MSLRKLIDKTRDTKPYENLKEILGKDLGGLIYKLVDKADRADKELDIIHACLTELYETDINSKKIKEALDKVENLNKQL